jgi:hypothetical protein
LKCLRRESTGRVPVAPFLYYNNVYEMFRYVPRMGAFFDPEDFDPFPAFVDYCERFGFDCMHTLGSAWDAYRLDQTAENWDVQVETAGAGDEIRRAFTIRTPAGTLRQAENFRRSSTYLIVSAIDEYLVKTPADFEILSRFAPPAEAIGCRLVTRARAAVGENGLAVACTHGAFNSLNMFRKLDDLMADPLTDEGFYRAMMEFAVDRLKRQQRKMVAAGADAIEMSGNMATSAVGPRFFEKFVLDYENRLARDAREAGAWVIYHNCGDAAKIMHLYNRLDIDVWGYLTPRPFGDVDLDQALAVIRSDLVLRGNVDQVEFLVKATPAEIRAHVRDLLAKVRPRGNWILSTTDFFFDETPYANIQAFAEAGREFGAG